MTYQQWLAEAKEMLADGDSPKCDAEILLSTVTGRERTYLRAFGETSLTVHEKTALAELLTRRCQGEPIAYLIGKREFWSLLLQVSPATLIPRPDTECLVEHALTLLSPHIAYSVLDLGTGTGAIALALAKERSKSHITGVDFNVEAVVLAQSNAQRLQLLNVQFLQSDWFDTLPSQQFSMIVSNPPYIDSADPHLLTGDVRFEPRSALIAEQNGLADIVSIVSQSRDFLLPTGWLLIEHGWQQGDVVRQCFKQYGYQQVATYHDYGQRERFTVGQWI